MRAAQESAQLACPFTPPASIRMVRGRPKPGSRIPRRRPELPGDSSNEPGSKRSTSGRHRSRARRWHRPGTRGPPEALVKTRRRRRPSYRRVGSLLEGLTNLTRTRHFAHKVQRAFVRFLGVRRDAPEGVIRVVAPTHVDFLRDVPRLLGAGTHGIAKHHSLGGIEMLVSKRRAQAIRQTREINAAVARIRAQHFIIPGKPGG